MRETQSLCSEGCKGAMTDDTVRVVTKDVFPGRRKLDRPVKACGKVRCEERPDLVATVAVRSPGKISRCAGFAEQNIDQVRDDDGPEEWYGAEAEEEGEEGKGAQSMAENDEGLQSALQRDVEGCPSDPATC